MAISITEKAAVKVQDYLKQVSDQSLALRIFVKAGGCAGYQFGLKLDKTSDSDVIEHKNGVNIVADPKSTTPTTKPPLTFPGQLAQSIVRGYATQKQATAYIHGKKSYDVDKVRHDFPILSRLINGKPLAYLDSAATAQKPVEVID